MGLQCLSRHTFIFLLNTIICGLLAMSCLEHVSIIFSMVLFSPLHRLQSRWVDRFSKWIITSISRINSSNFNEPHCYSLVCSQMPKSLNILKLFITCNYVMTLLLILVPCHVKICSVLFIFTSRPISLPGL